MDSWVIYESHEQLILGVVLPDGRELSIDMKKHPEKVENQGGNIVLVSGDYVGVAK